MSVSFQPIAPWPLVLAIAAGVTFMTYWGYRARFRHAGGGLRWVAVVLRFLAVLMCLMAAVRPSLIRSEPREVAAAVVFLIDSSTSMLIGDEVRGQSRWEAAKGALDPIRDQADGLGESLIPKFYRFDASLSEFPAEDNRPPEGRESALGSMLLEAVNRQEGTTVAAVVMHSDGASNGGSSPLSAADQLKARGVPVVTVGYGSETAGPESRDVAVREVVAGPTVFVKNRLQVRGAISARGFANQELDVELLVEGLQVATARYKVTANDQVLPIRDLNYVPESPGEKRVTVRVKPKEGELVTTNNETSTYVTVLSGGLGVLYVQGPGVFSWEAKYVTTSLDAAQDINAELVVMRRQGEGIDPEKLRPGRFDVFVLDNVPASALTPAQQRALVDRVQKGAGLMMIGGRNSFGAGGWAGTPLASVLPVEVSPDDGEITPENGVKVVPVPNALDNYLLQLGANRQESQVVWDKLPGIVGANNFRREKDAAQVLAQSPEKKPLLIVQDFGQGRSLAFAGESWVWARESAETLTAHRRFWRQLILWLAHKENDGQSQVRLVIDRRRVPRGGKLEISAQAVDDKGAAIPEAQFQAQLVRNIPDGKSEPLELFREGLTSKATYYANAEPDEYRLEVKATASGKDLGAATARFLVYQDDRELENPAANLTLLRQIAEATGGKALRPEELGEYLEGLKELEFTDSVELSETRLWDNWPFLLAFVGLLTTEWLVRKRLGWV